MSSGAGAPSGWVHTDIGSSANVNHMTQEAPLKASVRAKPAHPLRVGQQKFGNAMVRDRELAKTTVRLQMLLLNP